MPVELVFIVDDAAPSFFTVKPTGEAVPWGKVAEHECAKMKWDYPEVRMEVMTLQQVAARQDTNADVALVIGVQEPAQVEALQRLALQRNANAVVTKECSSSVTQQLERFGGFNPCSAWKPVPKALDDTLFNDSRWVVLRKVREICAEVWDRHSADDMLFALQCYIDAFSTAELPSVRAVTSTDETGLKEVPCMCSNCAKEMVDCFSDPVCRAALDCLNSCKGNDQVCSYRCITSFETPAFEKFVLRILQKHNCMGNSTAVPDTPDPEAKQSFRGDTLTHEVAEVLLQGWLGLSA